MNRSIRYIILAAVAALSLLSCNREEDSLLAARGEGLLSVSVGNAPELTVTTKAEEQEIFRIEVINSEGVTVATVDDHTTLAETPLALRVGRYTVRATHGEDVESAFNSPFYKGETEVDIVENEMASASITCALDRVKVSVSVSDEVKEKFTDYSIAVDNGNPGSTLVFQGTELGNTGYFRCTEECVLNYVVNLVNLDGDPFVIEQKITGVQPKDYYTISLDLNPEVTGSSAAAIRIKVDNSLNEHDHTMDVNLNKPARPVLTEAAGTDLSGTVRVTIGNNNKIGLFNLTAAGGVQSIVLTHDIQALMDKGVPASFSLSEPDPAVTTAAAAAGMLWAEFEPGATSVQGLLDIRTLLSNLEVGTYGMTLTVLDRYAQKVPFVLDIKVTPSMEVEVKAGGVNAWARKAYVTSVFYTESQPEGMAVQYRKKGENAWTQFSGDMDVQGTEFTVLLTGLEPATEYEVMPYTANEQNEAAIYGFTTEEAAQLPNFNFDSWTDSGHIPNAEGSSFWGTGNNGTSLLGKYATSQETNHVKNGSAAKLNSMFVGLGSFGKFAGGNIYSGTYIETVGMDGAKIDFGQPYTSRPTALHGWYDYAPVAIDYADGSHSALKGTTDVGKIFVALTGWSEPFHVNNTDGTLFSPDDPAVIAYGELEITESSNGEYKEFTIELDYRDLERKPTYVLVVATASKYADYFTGGNGSIMYIDEFQFIFE